MMMRKHKMRYLTCDILRRKKFGNLIAIVSRCRKERERYLIVDVGSKISENDYAIASPPCLRSISITSLHTQYERFDSAVCSEVLKYTQEELCFQ